MMMKLWFEKLTMTAALLALAVFVAPQQALAGTVADKIVTFKAGQKQKAVSIKPGQKVRVNLSGFVCGANAGKHDPPDALYKQLKFHLSLMANRQQGSSFYTLYPQTVDSWLRFCKSGGDPVHFFECFLQINKGLTGQGRGNTAPFSPWQHGPPPRLEAGPPYNAVVSDCYTRQELSQMRDSFVAEMTKAVNATLYP